MIGNLIKLFAMGEIKITEKGEFRMLGERAVVLYFTILEGMLEFFQKNFGERDGGILIYHSSKHGSKNYIRNIIHRLGYRGEKAIDFAGELASIGGWGRITVAHFDSEKKVAKIIVDSCPFKTEKPSKEPVCHFSRGMFAGAASVIWNEDVDCIETTCSSMGDPYCVFVIKRKRDFKNKILVKNQIGG